MFKVSFVAGALLLTGLPMAANAEPKTEATAKSDVHKIVCKKEETIGSRLAAKKVCLTVDEWRRMADENRNATERLQLNANADKSN